MPTPELPNRNSPLLRLAQDICMHLLPNGDPCNDCLMRAGEYMAPQRKLKAELRTLIARWRKVAGEWEAMVAPEEILRMGYLATSETLRTMARDLEKLLEEDH